MEMDFAKLSYHPHVTEDIKNKEWKTYKSKKLERFILYIL